MKLFQFQQSFITLQFAISQGYESIWIKMEKIKGFKIITWICYASCHRFQGRKNENIRAGALLNMKIWLVEVIYPQSNF